MIPFLEKAIAARPKPQKTGLSVVNVKKLVATMENMGKAVTSIQSSPDGSVIVSIGEKSPVGKTGANPWDEVLK